MRLSVLSGSEYSMLHNRRQCSIIYRRMDDNDEKKPKILKYTPLFLILAFAGFIAGGVLASVFDNGWLVFVGVGLFIGISLIVIIPYCKWYSGTLNKRLKENAKEKRTPEKEQELFDAVNNAPDVDENKLALAEYYGREADSVGELVASSFGFDKKGREALKTASRGDKLKVVALLGSLGLTALMLAVGGAIAGGGFGYIGFPIMGAGGGGFALILAVTIIISVRQKHYYKNNRATKESDRRDTEELKRGKVFRCSIHSQMATGVNKIHRTHLYDPQYQITVIPDGTQKYITMLCSRFYTEGEDVKFFQDTRHPRRVRLIEEECDSDDN